MLIRFLASRYILTCDNRAALVVVSQVSCVGCDEADVTPGPPPPALGMI